MSYSLTVGPCEKHNGRVLVIITDGGHPQAPGSEDCIVCALAWLDELPNRDPEAWFKQQVEERPWETRQ